jgi:hypothetical protein
MQKPHVLVLGPSRDREGDDWPLRLRLRVEKELLHRMRCPAVVMERVPAVEGENSARKFARILRDWDVRTFLVVWPKGCRLNGLDFELGWLANEVVHGRLDARNVVLATQRDNARVVDGVWALSEPGNRTRYYEALIDEGCTIRAFRTQIDLRRNVTATALEHLQRHILHAEAADFVGRAASGLADRAPS